MIVLRISTLFVIVAITFGNCAIAPRLKIKQRLLGKTGPITIKFDTQEIVLTSKNLNTIIDCNKHLNTYNHTYFNLPFLRDPKKIRLFLREDKTNDEQGIPFYLEKNSAKIPGTFFNRKSNNLVIISGGFTNCHEYMAPLVKIFPDYDLVFFDLPGHGLDRTEPQTTKARLAESALNLDISCITLGEKEVETIVSVAEYFKKLNNYTKTIGVARCYSVPFFAQAALDWEKTYKKPLFNKLILDSSFPSFEQFVPRLPLLFSSKSNAPLFRHICQSRFVKSIFSIIAEYFLERSLNTCSPIGSLLRQLKSTDLLFIHSKKDIVISDEDFALIWNELTDIEHKCVLFTHNRHAMNHIHQKELYKFIGESFINHSFNDFVRELTTL